MKKQILLMMLMLIIMGCIVSSYHPGMQQANTQAQKEVPQSPSTGSIVMVVVIMLIIFVGFVIWGI